ncbi:MAG: DUF433 domain-containing protein [Acidobacteriota bacterium]
MSRVRWQDHVVVADDLHHGEACIKGTRIPLRILIGSLADGMTAAEVLEAYPQLSPDDVLASLAYAADVLSQEVLAPMAPGSLANAHQGR